MIATAMIALEISHARPAPSRPIRGVSTIVSPITTTNSAEVGRQERAARSPTARRDEEAMTVRKTARCAEGGAAGVASST